MIAFFELFRSLFPLEPPKPFVRRSERLCNVPLRFFSPFVFEIVVGLEPNGIKRNYACVRTQALLKPG